MPSSPGHTLPGDPGHDLPSLPVDRPLTVPLLIRGSYDHGLFVTLCVGSAILAFIGGITLFRERLPGTATVFLSLAAATATLAAVVGLWLRQQRQWLEVTVTGFVLTHQEQRRVYTEDQVIGISRITHTVMEGNSKCRVILEIAANEGVERIDCRYSTTPTNPDPLAGFFDRLVNAISRRLEANLDSDASLRGEGWQFDRAGLRRGRVVYRGEDISWVGFYDGNLCIWRGDEERPVLRLPETGRNVAPLARVLWGHITRRPGFDRPLPGQPLGRVLLERWAWGFILGTVLMSVGAVVLFVVYLLMVLDWGNWGGLGGVAVACIIGVVIGTILTWRGRKGHIRFHEHGLAQRGFFGTRSLLYQELAEITWRRDQTLVFRPDRSLGQPTIRYCPMSNHLDREVAGMRDLACTPLAIRWSEEVPLGPLVWTKRLRFLPGGLEFRPMGLIGLCDPVSVPYEYTSYRVEGEYFLLFVSDQKRAACKERLTSPNFFVGLVLLNRIYATFQSGPDVPGLQDHAPRPLTESASPDARISPVRGQWSGRVTSMPPTATAEDE